MPQIITALVWFLRRSLAPILGRLLWQLTRWIIALLPAIIAFLAIASRFLAASLGTFIVAYIWTQYATPIAEHTAELLKTLPNLIGQNAENPCWPIVMATLLDWSASDTWLPILAIMLGIEISYGLLTRWVIPALQLVLSWTHEITTVAQAVQNNKR